MKQKPRRLETLSETATALSNHLCFWRHLALRHNIWRVHPFGMTYVFCFQRVFCLHRFVDWIWYSRHVIGLFTHRFFLCQETQKNNEPRTQLIFCVVHSLEIYPHIARRCERCTSSGCCGVVVSGRTASPPPPPAPAPWTGPTGSMLSCSAASVTVTLLRAR